MAVTLQIIYIISVMKDRMRNFKYTDNSFKRKKNSLFFNNFKIFVIQTSRSIYLLDYSDSIIEKNIHHRYEAVVLWIIFGIRLFLGLRFYKKKQKLKIKNYKIIKFNKYSE